MSSVDCESNHRSSLSDRGAGAALGIFVGLIAGVFVAVVALSFPVLSPVGFPVWIFGTTIAVACIGFAFPRVGFESAFGIGRFLLGLIAGRRSNIVLAFFGLLLYWYAWVTLRSGRLPGRFGLTSLTASEVPGLYWTFVGFCLLAGTLLVVYGAGRMFGVFNRLTHAIDQYLESRNG
jgi:hypothetical protein